MNNRELLVRETEDKYLLRIGRRKSKPAIRIQGNWLLKAGFQPGMKAKIVVNKGQLIIRIKEKTG
jgi:hypothetical protein